MGTRCLTVFKDDDNIEIAVLYGQYDGYYDGHGLDLIEFLEDRKICNGISGKDEENKSFNGMECLTASVIAHFKKKIGDYYLYPANTRDAGEEYIYTVSIKDGWPLVEMNNLDDETSRIILEKGRIVKI